MLPQLPIENLEQLILQHYNLKVSLQQLSAFNDLNYLAQNQNQPHQKFIFKISCSDQIEVFFRMRTHVLTKIGQFASEVHLGFPQLIPTSNNQSVLVISSANYKNYARLFKYVEGIDAWKVQNPSCQLMTEIGVMTAKLSQFLEKVTLDEEIQTLIKQIGPEDDLDNILSFPKKYKEDGHLLEPEVREIVLTILMEFQSLLPRIGQLPKQLIHNDICKANVIVAKKGTDYSLSGLVDFGDLQYACSLIDLTIVAAQINIHPEDPLKNAILVIQGYDSVKKLSEQEKDLILPLMQVRVAIQTLMAYRWFSLSPDNNYLAKLATDIVNNLVCFSKIRATEFSKLLAKEYL